MANKGEINPNPSDQWVKQTLVEDERLRYRRFGIDVPVADIDRQVQKDLRIADKEKNSAPPPPSPDSGTPVHRSEDPAGDAARELGYKYQKGGGLGGLLEPKRFRCNCNGKGHKFCALLLRMKILMARVGQTKSVGGDRIRGINFMHPEYGLAIAELFADYTLKRGMFKEASAPDGHRILLASMENICDRSNGIPGLPNWWVK
jgi:hypothetical protein